MGLIYGKHPDFERLVQCLTIACNFKDDKEFVGLGVYEKGRISVEDLANSRCEMFSTGYWQHTMRSIKAMIWFIVYNTFKQEQTNENEFRDYIFKEITGTIQLTLPGLETGQYLSGSQVNLAEGRVLSWFKEHGNESVKEVVDYLFHRNIYKRLIEVFWYDDEELYESLFNLKNKGLSVVDDCRIKLENKLLNELDVNEKSNLENNKAPLILIDIPWRDPERQEVYCIFRRNDKIKPFIEISPTWENLHRNFNKCVDAAFRVFVRPDSESIFTSMDDTELTNQLKKAIHETL